jgi:two-component sensor histidine kinase
MARLEGPGAYWALQAAGWIGLAAVYGVASLSMVPPAQAFGGKLVLAATGFGISLGLRAVYRSQRRRQAGGVRLVVAVGIACYLGGLVWTNVESAALSALGLAEPPPSWPTTRDALFFSIVLLAWSALYFVLVYARELDERREELERERQRSLVATSLAREAQLRALRYQLNPHFLFNTLNVISALVAEGQAEAAVATISRLAAFLRATLDEGDAEVTLERELGLLDQYLSIERARLQERLSVHIESAETVMDALVPVLLLQPLVENAVRHGIARRAEGGRVEVRAEPAGSRLRLTVRDDGPAAPRTPPASGLGLGNTEERLRQLFGADYVLALNASGTGGSEVVVELPLRRLATVAAAGPQ